MQAASAKLAFNEACRKWYADNGNVRCKEENGLIHLLYLYKEWKKYSTKEQSKKQMKGIIALELMRVG